MSVCSKGNGIKFVVFSVLILVIFHLSINVLSNKIGDSFFFNGSTKPLQTNYSSLKTSTSEFVYNEDSKSNNGTFFFKPLHRLSNLLAPDCVLPTVASLDGPVRPNISFESLQLVEQRLSKLLLPGGWYRPTECKATQRVAIIVPFRDRYMHLPIFLKNIHPFLMKQNIEYKIFIVEQTNGKLFNRAALMNIGFLESSKMFKWDCYIFHDVDLLPLDNRNLYTCPDQPRHMSVAIDVFGYKLPYSSIFGGVSAMTKEQFVKVNGFSNSFWGWGGEDDDMSNRLKHVNFHIARYPINIARYLMLTHRKEQANPKRYDKLANGASKFEVDGINSIKYDIYSFKRFPLFTWFLAEIKLPDQT